ncbi:sugar phosphate isomerase/epimerase [Nocardia sp. CA2R105]|uniref:sugar phosphate isomerase/epimerase family protein n=1 Tax=Nocardia coffeae TaxID=2873381 RepID=UPI001CA6CB6D|nr:TIM barrel protein [Nocardia coffeae]MBY8862867.1 sugar phosphate isomerase/epimerase [Nocardia coffeae]
MAAAAGFDAVSCWPNVWRHARLRDGLALADMRMILEDNGLVLTDCDGCREWVGNRLGSGATVIEADRHELFEVCSALGGTTITAVHDTEDGVDLDRDAGAFAQLCDDAAEYGLRVALEFVPFTTVGDLNTAWSLVETAGRANGGLVFDLWHHARSGADDSDVLHVPASRIFTVQLADGPRSAPGPDLALEARTGRRPPGAGEMGNPRLVQILSDMGVRAAVGPEVGLAEDCDVERRVADLYRATMRTLASS